MSGLHAGHLLRAALAAAVMLPAALGLLAPAASAETLGGEQLAHTTVTVSPTPDAAPVPKVKAATWVLADASTGEILAQKGSHVRRAPASTLKMLTALAVMPKTSVDTEYVATKRAAYIYGARVGLKPGKTYTMDQLWYAVFLPSANDAAIAVAEANGGVKPTIRQMNDVAFELRALDTVAKTTNGLDAPGQLSSAYDLALIAREGLAREDFAHYAGTVKAMFPDVKGKGSHPIYTTNRLLLHGWKGAIGVKTGFTSKAGRTYVGAATRGGRTLIVALMGIRESSEGAAKKLLRWGFRNAEDVTPVGVLVEKGSPLPTTDPRPDSGTGVSSPGTSQEAGAESGTADGGTGTTAAAAGADPTGIPTGIIIAALALTAGAGAVLVLRRRTRPSGRHAA